MRETIKDFSGKILGYVETQANGDQVATDFYGKILGYYRKNYDYTTDFYGRILTKGNAVVSFIYSAK